MKNESRQRESIKVDSQGLVLSESSICPWISCRYGKKILIIVEVGDPLGITTFKVTVQRRICLAQPEARSIFNP